MVVYSILLMDLSPTSYCLPKPLLVYSLMLLLSTSLLPSYSDQRKSYSGYVGVGLGIAHVVVFCCCFLTLTDPLRIQPWSQDRRNQTKSNRESEISMESRHKRTARK